MILLYQIAAVRFRSVFQKVSLTVLLLVASCRPLPDRGIQAFILLLQIVNINAPFAYGDRLRQQIDPPVFSVEIQIHPSSLGRIGKPQRL